MDLENLMNVPVDVWTASKIPQKYYEAPAIITTITREQIAVWGYQTMAELLGHLLGFYVVDDHITPNVAVRGTSGGLYADSSIIKVLVNGHSVSFSSTGGNALGPELIPLSAVERVEIIRGPASALYGADAFLGVVNIQTRDGESVNGVEARVAAGRVGWHPATDLDLCLGMSRGMVDVMLAFRRAQQDLSGLVLPDSSPAPAIPVYNIGARTARHLDQTSTAAITTVTLRPRAGTELGLFAYLSAMDRGAELGSVFQLVNGYNARGIFSENRVSRWQFRSGLMWNQALGHSLDLSFRGAYFQGGPQDGNRLEVGSDFYYVERRFGFRGTDLDSHLVWTPADSLHVIGGGSLLVDREELPSRIAIAKQSAEAVRPGEVIEANTVRGGRKMFINAGAYLQGTWDALGPQLGITGGLRYDHHNIYGSQLSRRIGLVSSPWPTLHAKLLHGSAFKAPSPLLLYAVPSANGDVVGNAQLKPQFVNTFELQIEYTTSSRLLASSGVVYNLLDDKTEFIQEGGNKTARNVTRAATVSWESQIQGKYPRWLHTQVSLELQRTVQRPDHDDYVREVLASAGSIYPQVMVHAGIAVQPPRAPVRGALLASYVGSRRASGNNVLLHGDPYRLPPYVLFDASLATVGFRVLRGAPQEISFQLSGKNLLGATGPAPGFAGVDYPLSPRAFLLQINLTL
jgi:iron complex outermembrane receptor protein